MRADVEMVVGHNFARVGCSRSVVGPYIACSLRSRVAPAPEILCFAPLSIVMRHEPQAQEQHRLDKSQHAVSQIEWHLVTAEHTPRRIVHVIPHQDHFVRISQQDEYTLVSVLTSICLILLVVLVQMS